MMFKIPFYIFVPVQQTVLDSIFLRGRVVNRVDVVEGARFMEAGVVVSINKVVANTNSNMVISTTGSIAEDRAGGMDVGGGGSLVLPSKNNQKILKTCLLLAIASNREGAEQYITLGRSLLGGYPQQVIGNALVLVVEERGLRSTGGDARNIATF